MIYSISIDCFVQVQFTNSVEFIHAHSHHRSQWKSQKKNVEERTQNAGSACIVTCNLIVTSLIDMFCLQFPFAANGIFLPSFHFSFRNWLLFFEFCFPFYNMFRLSRLADSSTYVIISLATQL